MGQMMGGASLWAWLLPLVIVAVAVAVTGGIAIARSRGARSTREPPRAGPADPPAVQSAKDALRMRYARGEISREEYLQGKVELED